MLEDQKRKKGNLTRARAYVNTSLIRIKEIVRNGNTVECGSSVGRNDVTAFSSAEERMEEKKGMRVSFERRTIYVCASEKERIINGNRANERNRMKGNIRVNRTMYVYALGNVAHLTEI